MAVIRNNKKFFSNDRFGFTKLEYFLRFSFALLNHFYIFALNFYDKKHLALLPVAESNFHKSVY